MAPRTRSFITSGGVSRASSDDGIHTEPNSTLSTSTHPQPASSSMEAEIPPGTLTTLDPPLYAVNKEVTGIATGVIKGCAGEIGFSSKGKTYYGVKEGDLGDLVHYREPAIPLAKILDQVVKGCGETQPQDKLQEAMLLFNSAIELIGSRDRQGPCLIFVGHARRAMARLIVAYEGYYEDHPEKLSTLNTIGRIDKKPSTLPPVAIQKVYGLYTDDQSPLEYLTWQLLELSSALSKRVARLPGAKSLKSSTASGRTRVGGKFTKKTADASVVASEDTHGSSEAASETSPPVWDISNQAVLRDLARQYLILGDAYDVRGAEAEHALEHLISDAHFDQLPAPHQTYFDDKLLPGLNQGGEDPIYHLAIVLGYFDWSRANATDAEAALPSYEDNDGALYEALYNSGMALAT
jgi:hypothetical protein